MESGEKEAKQEAGPPSGGATETYPPRPRPGSFQISILCRAVG